MADSVNYERRDKVALISIDDGKANALSASVIAEINAGLDTAADDGAGAVVLAGRPGMFSGGFDLSVMRSGDLAAVAELVTSGGELMLRVYRSEMPIVAACTGHAVAAGAFLLMASHFRVGTEGDYRFLLIETQIGMVLPDWAVELTAHRLVGPHVEQAAIESRVYAPADAVAAGFLDKLVPDGATLDAALAEGQRLAELPAAAYAGNALKVRANGIERVAAAVARDRATIGAR